MKKICVLFGLLLFAAACERPSSEESEGKESEVKFGVEVTPYQGGVSSALLLDEGAPVSIQVEDIENPGSWGEIQDYAVNGGMLTSEYPFVMKEGEGRKIVRAWYPGSGYAALSSVWEVSEDQTSRKEGLSSDDLLYATSTMGYGQDGELVFYPQTAKVTVNVLKNEYLTDLSQISGLTLGDGDLAMSGNYSFPVSGVSVGDWTVEGGDGTIAPLKLASATSGSLASYSATVIPQDMTGKNLIVLTLENGVSMRYVPSSEDAAASIKGGREYVCEVTVNGNELTLNVTVSEGGAWTDGGSTDIDSDPLTYEEYGPQDTTPKVGDYYYSDGSWSDGGLRRVYYADGEMVWDENKPSPSMTNPETGQPRSVIGIVFTTDAERMGDAEKQALEAAGVEPHGLVVSTMNAGDGAMYAWCYMIQDETPIGLPNIVTFAESDADIDGYYYNQQIRNERGGSMTMYAAFKAAADFDDEAGCPEGTTGWYLPSSGQWFDILRNLGDFDISDTADSFMNMSEGTFMWMDAGDVPMILNEMMSKVPDDSKDPFTADYVWTSSAVSTDNARRLFLDNFGFLRCESTSKGGSSLVRPVLAF